MDVGNDPVGDVIDRVAGSGLPAWARWALDYANGRWSIRYAEVFVGAPPPGYAKRRWNYSAHRFLEQPATISQIRRALTGRTLRVGGVSAYGLSMQLSANRSRQQSYADFGGQRLPWPTARYEVNCVEGNRAAAGNDPLISQTSPSFGYFDAAFRAFFRPGSTSRWEQRTGVVVVMADTGALIKGLRIRPGQVLVDIAGDNLRGCILQISSGGQVQSRTTLRPQEFAFTLPDPFDHELLVVLADDGWRDLRLINPPGLPNTADPSIVWDDPEVQLAALLARGEGQSVEFKEKVPDKTSGSVRTALKALSAFANSAGGSLIFGVADDGVVVGLPEEPTAAVARLNDLIHSNVRPVPNFRIEEHQVEGRPVIVVVVEPGSDRPYGLFRDPPQFYVRHGATSFHATREEIVALSARPDRPGSLR